MSAPAQRKLKVVVVSLHLDTQHRSPADLLASWRDFARPQREAMDAAPGLEIEMVHAAWADDLRQAEGIPCHFVREPAPFLALPGGRQFRRLPRRLFSTVEQLAPDLVHFEGLLFPRELHALARRLPSVPIVAQDHGSKLRGGWRQKILRWGFGKLTAAIFTAREQAEPFKSAGVLREDLPIFEVLEGSSPFSPGDVLATRARLRLEGDPCLLWLGNLDPNKDPLMVLDAVAHASASLPKIRLYMCYRNAPLLPVVRQRLADPILATRVTLVGEVPYPGTEAYLQAADFVVQGSHAEGSGFAVIEALACGTTPLVTDIPSFRRITGTCGALVAPNDVSGLARAIVSWSSRDRAVLRRAARERFERSLSFSAVGRELRSTYQQVSALR
jgi:glycosyltransferase involved in cell wall biosynthesis